MIELLNGAAALDRIGAADIAALTEAATRATYYRSGLTAAQVASIRRIVEIAAPNCVDAIANPNRHFAAAFVAGAFGGYVIATVHAEEDRELDWLMVDPAFHGRGVATVLADEGLDWLGRDRALWLNVVRHNERAIRFYRRFGFEIDPAALTGHVVPHHIMRRTVP
jgi:ribosomal protein S18 acetylase RimI-like enzyme